MINKYYSICEVNKELIEFIKQDLFNLKDSFMYSRLIVETSNCILNNSTSSNELRKEENNISNYFFNDIKKKYYQYGISNIKINSNYTANKEMNQNFIFQFLLKEHSVRLDFSYKNNIINLDFITFNKKNGFYVTFNCDFIIFFLGLKNIERETFNIMNERIIIKYTDVDYTSEDTKKYLKEAEDFITCIKLIEDISKNDIYSNFNEQYLKNFFSSVLYQKESIKDYKDISDFILLNFDINIYSLNNFIDLNFSEKIYFHDNKKTISHKKNNYLNFIRKKCFDT